MAPHRALLEPSPSRSPLCLCTARSVFCPRFPSCGVSRRRPGRGSARRAVRKRPAYRRVSYLTLYHALHGEAAADIVRRVGRGRYALAQRPTSPPSEPPMPMTVPRLPVSQMCRRLSTRRRLACCLNCYWQHTERQGISPSTVCIVTNGLRDFPLPTAEGGTIPTPKSLYALFLIPTSFTLLPSSVTPWLALAPAPSVSMVCSPLAGYLAFLGST